MNNFKTLFLLAMLSLFAAGCATQPTGSPEAEATANEALETADDALSTANQALDAVRRLEEKVDRMFDRALQK